MRQRRVGTFTLALVLIFLGITIPLSLFAGSAYSGLLKFAPLALVALGIEIIIAALTRKEEKLTYDGFSIFLTIVVTVVTIFSATVMPTISRAVEYGREYNNFYNEYVTDTEDELYDNGINADVWAHNDLGFFEFLDYTEDDSSANIGLIDVSIGINYKDSQPLDDETVKNDFVKAIRIAAKDQRVKSVGIHTSHDFEDDYMYSSLSAGFNMSVKRISKLSDEELKAQIRFDRNERKYNGEIGSDEVTSSEIASSEVTSSEDAPIYEEGGEGTSSNAPVASVSSAAE